MYADGRSVDGYGLDVDVLVDGKDAWTKGALLRLVAALGDAKRDPRPGK